MKIVSLLSSGIDSPVATFLISKKADELIFVHADIMPFSDFNEKVKFLELAKYLSKKLDCPTKVIIVSHGNNLLDYKKNCDAKFTCVFCKRMMLRYAEKIAELYAADAIVTGDNLGQVASQTLQNIKTIEEAVKIPILRPLIGFDKEETIKIAKEIGTYELSIKPSIGCSAVPNKPSTMAKIDKILSEEKKINIKRLVSISIKNLEVVSL
jgi:thiamine biosynthesis protein ThiI